MNTHCCNYEAGQIESRVSSISSIGTIGRHTRFLNLLKTWWTILCGRLSAHYELRKQRRIDRDAFRRLLVLDESTLKDIGISRNDVIWASQLPLSVNASLELEKIARRPGRR